jgi:single-strand DNA-binding protein
MKSVNMAVLMGNMTRDAELRYTPNGKAVASFGLAVNRVFKDASGERQSSVDFFDIVAWGKLAEIISQYGKKGKGVHVIGRLQNRSWEAQDGSKRNKTEVVATDISLVGAKGEVADVPVTDEGVDEPAPEELPAKEKETEEKGPKKEGKAKEEEINIDDIPF